MRTDARSTGTAGVSEGRLGPLLTLFLRYGPPRWSQFFAENLASRDVAVTLLKDCDHRLSTPSDRVLATVAAAVKHALAHNDVVQKDGERLRKRTGCCVPAPKAVAPEANACCAPAAASIGRRASIG